MNCAQRNGNVVDWLLWKKEAEECNYPRLVISYKAGETRDKDQYAWGISGQIPLAHLVGFLGRVQMELAFCDYAGCDGESLVVIYVPVTQTMTWFVDPAIPVDPLGGFVELVKQTLVGMQMEQMARARHTGIIGPDGKPILKR